MKTRIMVAGFLLACFTANAVAGENFVQTFLNRYKPSPTAAARTAAAPLTVDQAVEVLIRNGSLPLTIPDMIRLMLDSSLDVRVYRFSPLESQYLITSALRAFEPTLHINFGVSRNTFPGSSQL